MTHEPHKSDPRHTVRGPRLLGRGTRSAGLVAWLLPLALLSCRSYNQKTERALEAFRGGDLETAQRLFGERELAESEFLNGVEAGMVAFTGGDFERAEAYLSDSAEAVRDFERTGFVSPRTMVETALKWTLTEGAAPYKGEGYERVLLHTLLGLTYLARYQLEDALVEAKLADRLLTTEEQLFDADYRAGGLGHFVSALAYELIGEPDEAYLDYRRLHEKQLAPALVGPSLVRLARELGRPDEEREWLERYGPVEPAPEGAARVVLIAGVGLGPYKVEDRLDLPTGRGVFSAAVPRVERRAQAIAALALEAGRTSVLTTTVEDVGRVMSENLDDRLALLTLRSVGRGLLKHELTRRATEEHGLLGLIVMGAFTIATERADLRAWTTLPDSWQVARVLLPPGMHRLAVSAVGGSVQPLGTYLLEPGETVVVLARSVGSRLYVHPLGGLVVEPPAVEASWGELASAPRPPVAPGAPGAPGGARP